MTAGDSKSATTTPQPGLVSSPQSRPAPTRRALPSKPVAQRGQNWTPIRGQICKPIDIIALDIWEHFKQVCRPDGFKAQIAAIDREAIVLYRSALSTEIAADLVRNGVESVAAEAKAKAMIA